MKIFISYRFTGEDLTELEKFMKQVCSALQQSGHQPLTTFWKNEEYHKTFGLTPH
jgi:hypothetical protein